MTTPANPRFREAHARDLPALVGLLADDAPGQTRETVTDPLPDAYMVAFEALERDPHQRLLLALDEDGILGMLQLSLIPGLSRQGSGRGQIESVRAAAAARGCGVGGALIEQAVATARDHGCALVQLTTDKRRPDALRFYRPLGFVDSHEGLKLVLD